MYYQLQVTTDFWTEHKGVMDAFRALLVAFCLAGKCSPFRLNKNLFVNPFIWRLQKASSYRVGTSYCETNGGFCSWTAPIDCDNPTRYCGSEAECFVISKSINSSYDSSSGVNQQFQCRCPVGAPIGDCNPKNPYASQGSLFMFTFFHIPPTGILFFHAYFLFGKTRRNEETDKRTT